MKKLFFLLLSVTGFFAAPAAEPLWRDGTTRWAVVCSPDADIVVQHAAEEIAEALGKCSGASFETLDYVPGGRPSIIVGARKDSLIKPLAAKLGLPEEVREREDVVIRTAKSGQLIIAGVRPRACLNAAEHFLREYVGVRFLWMGEEGAFYPKRRTFSLPEKIDWKYNPAIRWRGFHLCGQWYRHEEFREWMSRNMLNTHKHSNHMHPEYCGFEKYAGGAVLDFYNKEAAKHFAAHPEWFALVSGKRNSCHLCYSNHDSVETLADSLDKRALASLEKAICFVMYGSDNIYFCECPECRSVGTITSMFGYYNAMAAEMKKRHPAIHLWGLAYSGGPDAPNCKIDYCENLDIATYNKCNHHLMNDPTCPPNVKLLRQFEDWKKLRTKYGLKMSLGEYRYDFDVFELQKSSQLTPNFTVMHDAVKTAVKYEHVTMVPEIGLTPKNGPAIEVCAVLNRLPIAYFALSAWNPELTPQAFLEDATKTVWGPAWKPIYDYYLTLDQAWTDCKIHTLILKPPSTVAASFIKPPTVAAAKKCFAEAAAILKTATAGEEYPTFDPARAKAELDFEMAAFRRWEAIAGVQRGERPRIALPQTDGDEPGCEARKLVGEDGKESKLAVKCGWDPAKREIIVRWEGAGKRQIASGLHLEATFLPGLDGKRLVFGTRSGAKQEATSLSADGAPDRSWKPKWKIDLGEKAVVMRLPMDAIESGLDVNKTVGALFTAGTKRGKTDAAYPSLESDLGALLEFSRHAAADRPALVWLGCPSRSGSAAALVDQAAKCGWKAVVTDDDGEFRKALGSAEMVLMIHPEKENLLSDGAWKALRKRVKDEGLLLGAFSNWNMKLEKGFGDPSFAFKVIAVQAKFASAHKFEYIAEGDWGTKVYPIAETLKRGSGATYLFEPVKKDVWTTLAAQYNKEPGKPPVPCISIRDYGKGRVVVFGAANCLNKFGLMTNLKATLR